MTTATPEQITHMIEMLPAQEQVLALELIKRLILAWDPDFTKVTQEEALALDEAMADIERGEIVTLEDIKAS